jgi:hypothetical protein
MKCNTCLNVNNYFFKARPVGEIKNSFERYEERGTQIRNFNAAKAVSFKKFKKHLPIFLKNKRLKHLFLYRKTWVNKNISF